MNMSKRNWWDQSTFLGITRNDALLLGLLLGVGSYLVFGINWDWVFGLR